MRRIVVFGNSGSGKTTLARVLTSQYGLAHLDLDSLAWDSPGGRRSLTESASTIRDFIHEHSEWVIEGCYGDLLEQVLPYASEVRFLNPGRGVHRQLSGSPVGTGEIPFEGGPGSEAGLPARLGA
jgi:adenylate kinase family enzyme